MVKSAIRGPTEFTLKEPRTMLENNIFSVLQIFAQILRKG